MTVLLCSFDTFCSVILACHTEKGHVDSTRIYKLTYMLLI